MYRKNSLSEQWKLVNPSPVNGIFRDAVAEDVEYDYKMLPVCSTNGQYRECETADCNAWKFKIKTDSDNTIYIDFITRNTANLKVKIK